MAPYCSFLALHWEAFGLEPVIRKQLSLHSFISLLSLLLGLTDYSLRRTEHGIEVSSIVLCLAA